MAIIKDTIDWLKGKFFVQKIAEASMMEVAEFMAARARQYAPVDTGLLRNSITVQSSKAGAVIHVIATAPYAQWVEFGHMAGSTFVAPNPFMRRARDDAANQFPEIVAGVAVSRPGDVNQYLGATFQTTT